MTTKGFDSEGREGNAMPEKSDNNAQDGTIKKKRQRVGDIRKQSFATESSKERNPYRSSEYSDRQSYGNSYNNRGNTNGGERKHNDYNGGSRSNFDNRNRDNRSYDNRSQDNRNNNYSDNRRSYSNRYSEQDDYRQPYNRQPYSREGGNQNRRPYSSQQNRDYRDKGSFDNRGGFDKGGASGVKRLVKPVKYKENIDPNTPIRLNKYLANAGVCSRREADSYITAGVVKVNGTVTNELGTKVKRGDLVTFHDQPVRLESKVYVLLNKPKNCVTTSDDPENRKTVMDLVKGACPERIYPVGRLDRNTTGVLLLTNDGDLASKLTHPKFMKKKIYQVTLDKDVAIEDMQAIADGIELDDGEIHADSIAYQSEDVLNVVGIEIHSGRNRLVRRIFEKLGYHVIKLDRVYFAGLTKKNIPRGKWRYLSEKEVNMLRMGAFE